MPDPGKNKKDNIGSYRAAANLISIGMLLVISTAIGYFFGHWLDTKLGTDPWFMLIFTLIGIAAGFIEMIKLIDQATKED